MSWKRKPDGRRTILWLLAGLAIALLVFYVPPLLAYVASQIALAHDCPLAVMAPQPCLVGGLDIGSTVFKLIRYQTLLPVSMLAALVIAIAVVVTNLRSFMLAKRKSAS
ncbi:MAG: hypothetical protein AAF141_00445 [Pseudomonadota bacterium]